MLPLPTLALRAAAAAAAIIADLLLLLLLLRIALENFINASLPLPLLLSLPAQRA